MQATDVDNINNPGEEYGMGGELVAGGTLRDEGEDEVIQVPASDILRIPEEFLLEDDEEGLAQSEIMATLVGRRPSQSAAEKVYELMPVDMLNLSTLKEVYKSKNVRKALTFLDSRHKVAIDEEYELSVDARSGRAQRTMRANQNFLDYELTVANCIGISAILPNTASSAWFGLQMDLSKPFREFKGKHATLGFNPKGCMLYIGRCNEEDVFLAMVPNHFLDGGFDAEEERQKAKKKGGSSTMSARHYRQMVMMLAHFFDKTPGSGYYLVPDVRGHKNPYKLHLGEGDPKFDNHTNLLNDGMIRLNFELVRRLDHYMVRGYDDWANKAPAEWTADSFLQNNKPIVVTSRYGQDARFAVPGHEEREAQEWENRRDYSKIAFLTVAIATCIESNHVSDWVPIPLEEIERTFPRPYYNVSDHNDDRTARVNLADVDLTAADGKEIAVYDRDGDRVQRFRAVVDRENPCAVLVDLSEIQGMYNANTETDVNLGGKPHLVKVEAFPLGFLGHVGNIQAGGVPHCFYRVLERINEKVRKNHPVQRDPRHVDAPARDEDEDEAMPDEDDRDEDAMAVDVDNYESTPSTFQAVRPISSQLYNMSTHRVATRAGALDTERGTVTAAIAGAYARNPADVDKATRLRSYCDTSLPSDRYDHRISQQGCETQCRAELVYTIDVRALRTPSGKTIFRHIILPLTQEWRKPDILKYVSQYLVVLKPSVFPDLYKWVAYPVATLIKMLYAAEKVTTSVDKNRCPFRLELIASLERTLCFCHTGNTAVLATSLMRPLLLSKSVVKDGFPMLTTVFHQKRLCMAFDQGLIIDPSKWPAKDGYPAVASKRSQIVTYSLQHFMAYQAILRMHFVASEGDVSIISEFDRTDPVEKSLHILKVAFEALFDDVKALVSDGVKADLRRRSKAATTPQEKEIHLQRAEVREKHLKLWMKHKNPLTYGEKSVTYENLLKAISPDDSAVLMGLGAHRNKNVTPKSFADSLFNMSHPIHPTQAVAPVLQSGAFLSVLCVAHSELLLMADHLTVPEREESTKGMFLRAVHHFHISTYPSSLPKSGTSGAPHRKPIFDSWVLLSKKDPLPTSAFGYPSNSVSVLHRTPPETIASINAINDDCNGPWYANKLEMSDLSTIVNKMKLPKDFTISTAPAKYVDDTYKWIIGAYLGTKSIHHLALLVAIIASCSLLPNLFTSKLKSGLFPVGITRSQVDDVYASLKWEPKDIPNASAKQSKSAKKKSNPSAAAKGMTDRGIFIGMITTFIVALYEEESPLRVDMATNPSSGLGDGWTSKHTVKGLTYSLLLRLGMVWGEGPGAYSRGKFRGAFVPDRRNPDLSVNGSGWGLKDPADLDRLYHRLCTCLKSSTFGPFDALALLIGDANARIATVHKQFSARPSNDDPEDVDADKEMHY